MIQASPRDPDNFPFVGQLVKNLEIESNEMQVVLGNKIDVEENKRVVSQKFICVARHIWFRFLQ